MVWKSSRFKTSVPKFLIAKYQSKFICRVEQRQKGNYEIMDGENEANIKKKNTKLFIIPGLQGIFGTQIFNMVNG